MFPSKEDLIKRLRNDPMYKAALKMAPNDEERRKIIATTEGFLANIVQAFGPAVKHISANKDLATKLQEAINGNATVVKESDSNNVVSGSIG